MALVVSRALARRYARAAMQIASEANEVERWREELGQAFRVLADADLVAALQQRRAPLERRLELARQTVLGLSPLVMNLVLLLVVATAISFMLGEWLDAAAIAFAAFAPSLPRSSPATNRSPTRVSPCCRKRSAAAICATRIPFASHDPRPYRRPAASWLSKNGGTQSKCVEKTREGSPVKAKTLKRPLSSGCSVTW